MEIGFHLHARGVGNRGQGDSLGVEFSRAWERTKVFNLPRGFVAALPTVAWWWHEPGHSGINCYGLLSKVRWPAVFGVGQVGCVVW